MTPFRSALRMVIKANEKVTSKYMYMENGEENFSPLRKFLRGRIFSRKYIQEDETCSVVTSNHLLNTNGF